MIQHKYNEFSFNQIQSSKCSLFILFGGTLHLSQKNITVQKLIPFSASTGTPFLNGYFLPQAAICIINSFYSHENVYYIYNVLLSRVCVCDSGCNPMWVHVSACAILCVCVFAMLCMIFFFNFRMFCTHVYH